MSLLSALKRNLVPGKIKTTPIRFFGMTGYLNAGAGTMARRADKVNDKRIDEGIDTLFAQIANDSKLGMYYGIYTLRIECMNTALRKLRRKDYLIIRIGADTDYIYLALYWGHWTTLENPRLFARFFASYVSETALYSGKKGVFADKSNMKFPAAFEKRIKFVSKEYHKPLKDEGIKNYKEVAEENVRENLVLQAVARFVVLLKGGQPLYVPDQACMDGMIKLSENSGKNIDNAVRGMRTFVEVLNAMGIWDKFAASYSKYKKSNLYQDCMNAAKKMDEEYHDKLDESHSDKIIQILAESQHRTPEESKIMLKLLKAKK